MTRSNYYKAQNFAIRVSFGT